MNCMFDKIITFSKVTLKMKTDNCSGHNLLILKNLTETFVHNGNFYLSWVKIQKFKIKVSLLRVIQIEFYCKNNCF